MPEATARRDAIASLLQSDPRQAGRLAADFLRAVQSSPSPAVLAVAWRARAEAFVYSGELLGARSAYEKACSLAEAAGDAHLLGQILVGRIGTLLAMGEFRSARSLTGRAESLLRSTGDQDYLRRLHINLGSGHYHRERYAEAYASFREALRLMNEAGQRDSVWASLNLNHGVACSQIAHVEEARAAFQQAETFGRAHSLDRLVAQAIFNQGALEGLRGSYRSALRLLGQAEEAFARQEVGELLAASHLEQAQIYLELAMPGEARDLARRAADSFAAEGMLLDSQLARLAEAKSLLSLDRPVESAALLREAERFYRARRIRPRRAQILLELARAQSAQGQDALASTTTSKAIRLAEDLGLKDLQCAALCHCADIFLRRGKADRAEKAIEGWERLLPHLPMRDRLRYWSTAARTARARGNPVLAGRRYRKAARCLEAQRALIPGLELRARSFEREVGVYHEQISLMAASATVRLEPVIRLMQLSRGRTFRELMETGGRKADEEIVQMRAVLGSMVRRLELVSMGGRPEDGKRVDQLRKQILSLEREITTRFRTLETREAASGGHIGLRSPAEIASALRPGEVYIQYFVAGEQLLAAVISKEKRFLRVLATPAGALRAGLDHLILQLDLFAATASRPLGNPAFLRRSAEARLQELHSMLLAPLLKDLPPEGRLILVPHDFLHQVPFECLHDGTDYLDASWQVTRCPTADFLVLQRSRPLPPTNGSVLAIAGTRPGSTFIEEEARRVLGSWPASSGRLLLDPSSEEALSAMRDASLIHLSAHGSFREDNPLFSTLHLGQGVLFLADILETRLAANLVVLSACNTGLVFSGKGDALLGVAHAFLAAGAACLVASLWRVHDAATAEWMELFHSAVRETGDPWLALHSAARALRERWPHPFYWGAFSVLGA